MARDFSALLSELGQSFELPTTKSKVKMLLALY